MTLRLVQLGKHLVTMATKTDITLYTAATPNGIKASILLAELGLEYKVGRETRPRTQLSGLTRAQTYNIKMMDNEQKEPWFLDINPNGRIPAITDKLPGGQQIRVFESGAILEYLVDRYDKDHKVSYPRDTAEHWEVTSWVGRGPPPPGT